ncbi:MAG: hypothetical protein IT480_13035 [Gammaproteobacteria bacterium]|nr:hypothetical protein [Gammaproteobacteria bacterium]
MQIEQSRGPDVTFYRLIPGARVPLRADSSALGTMPTRAFRYCDAITTASAFGWYLFPPMEFSLLFDGREVLASWDGTGGWFPLSSVQFPDFAAEFDAAAPDDVKGYAPPFLSALPEPGFVQLWTGLVARTAPAWSLLLRPCANLPATKGFEPFEGVLETDRWFGPLFLNLRLQRTDCPIEITPEWPIATAQPVPQIAYRDASLRIGSVVELAGLGTKDWEGYRQTVVRRSTMPDRRPGSYAVEARKRRRAADIESLIVMPSD